jgi:amino acid transporter
MTDIESSAPAVAEQPPAAMALGPDGQPTTHVQEGHYKQELSRALSVLGNIALTLSAITPASSLFIIVPVLFATTGSGTFLSLVIAAVIGVAMALCWAELGSAYPIAGGDYAITTRVLGRAAGFLALVLGGVAQAVLIPAVIALGMSTFLAPLFSADPKLVAAIVMAAATVLAVFGVRFNAFVLGVFLVGELVAVAVVVVLGLVNAQQPVSELFSPHVFSADGGASALTTGIIVASLGIALFVYNGYAGAIQFSEETEGPSDGIARAILVSLGIAVAAILVPVVALLLGTPSLSALTTDANPLQYLITELGGSTLYDVISLAVAGAIFNATVALLLLYSRIFFSSGRDRAWPGPINDWLAAVHPTRHTPWVATILGGVIGIALVLLTDVLTLSTWTGVALAIDYGLIAIAALVSRLRSPGLKRPYRMPLWPVAPLVGIAGCALVLSKQAEKDLRVAAIVAAGALVYYLVFLRPRKETHMLVYDVAGESRARASS